MSRKTNGSVAPGSRETVSLWHVVAGSGLEAPSVCLDEGITAADSEPPAGSRPPYATAGRYAVLGEIARGGMGAVLRGRDSELNRDLARKVLLEKQPRPPRDRPPVSSRRRRSGPVAAHPGIVPIYDLGLLPDKLPFFAMKLVKGRTMEEMLESGKFRQSPRFPDFPSLKWRGHKDFARLPSAPPEFKERQLQRGGGPSEGHDPSAQASGGTPSGRVDRSRPSRRRGSRGTRLRGLRRTGRGPPGSRSCLPSRHHSQTLPTVSRRPPGVGLIASNRRRPLQKRPRSRAIVGKVAVEVRLGALLTCHRRA